MWLARTQHHAHMRITTIIQLGLYANHCRYIYCYIYLITGTIKLHIKKQLIEDDFITIEPADPWPHVFSRHTELMALISDSLLVYSSREWSVHVCVHYLIIHGATGIRIYTDLYRGRYWAGGPGGQYWRITWAHNSANNQYQYRDYEDYLYVWDINNQRRPSC